MANIVQFDFEKVQLPAHVTSMHVGDDDLTSGVGGGYPVISIKGKVFHIVRGEERTLVTTPENDEQPAGAIDVVLLRANPHLSKTFYMSGYQEGSVEKPDCYSNDGIAPAADAQTPQSQKCATCPNNQWGSKITEQGSKAKACADVRRLAVAPAGQINDPMLLRVPAASLKPLYQYGEMLKKRGVKYPAMLTRVGFDYTVAHPALTFKPVGFVTPEMAREVQEMIASDLVAQIVGITAPPQPDAAPQIAQVAASPLSPEVAPVVGQPAVAAPVQPVQAPAPVQQTPAAPAKKRTAAPKQNAFAAAPADAAPAAQPTPVAPTATAINVVDDGLEAELAKVLNDAGFDG